MAEGSHPPGGAVREFALRCIRASLAIGCLLKFHGNRAGLADNAAFAAFLAPLRKIEWVVYAKEPFGGPEAVLA
jgi:hypothetical protein